MRISALVQSSEARHRITLRTGDNAHGLTIPPQPTGFGSSVNGGELLFVALATCYCNDLYREATKRGLRVERVEVEVEGEFGAEGEPARNVTYHVRVAGWGTEADLRELLHHTDRVAEIQNTLRSGVGVTLGSVEVTSI